MKLLLLALIGYLAKRGIIVFPFNLKWFSKKKMMIKKGDRGGREDG
jgi:ribosomal protein L15E